jgi:O-methyltransferase involved in polyketide biosynthesis
MSASVENRTSIPLVVLSVAWSLSQLSHPGSWMCTVTRFAMLTGKRKKDGQKSCFHKTLSTDEIKRGWKMRQTKREAHSAAWHMRQGELYSELFPSHYFARTLHSCGQCIPFHKKPAKQFFMAFMSVFELEGTDGRTDAMIHLSDYWSPKGVSLWKSWRVLMFI